MHRVLALRLLLYLGRLFTLPRYLRSHCYWRRRRRPWLEPLPRIELLLPPYLLLVLVVATILAFHKVSKTATVLLIPYLVWLCIATALNTAMALMIPSK